MAILPPWSLVALCACAAALAASSPVSDVVSDVVRLAASTATPPTTSPPKGQGGPQNRLPMVRGVACLFSRKVVVGY